LDRDKQYLEGITVDAPYLVNLKYSTLSGTRNSAATAATYAVMHHLGREGYRSIVAKCMENTRHLATRVRELGLELVIEPTLNILGIKLNNANKVVDELIKNDWFVSRGQYPECLRIVVMPHVTREVIDEFIPVLASKCKTMGEISH
jgi:tyrosine decarboxylase/aspartate 1-decarboxylase